MPRLPRAELEAGIYHVIARGNRKQVIYVDDDDHRRYLGQLGRVVDADAMAVHGLLPHA